MGEFTGVAVAFVCLAFLAGVIIYGFRISKKLGDNRASSQDRLLRFGLLGAVASLVVDTITSAAGKTSYPDKQLKKIESAEVKNEIKSNESEADQAGLS